MQTGARCVLRAFAGVCILVLLTTAPAKAVRWGNGYVPNVPVVTQEGKVLQFYDDLIKDKIFVISFFYTSCAQICPLATARFPNCKTYLGTVSGARSSFTPSASTRKTTRPSV